MLKKNISDINAQPKIFSKTLFDSHLAVGAPSDFSLDLFILFQSKAQGIQVLEFPVLFKDRISGTPKGGGGGLKMKYTLIKRTFNYMYQLKKNVNG